MNPPARLDSKCSCSRTNRRDEVTQTRCRVLYFIEGSNNCQRLKAYDSLRSSVLDMSHPLVVEVRISPRLPLRHLHTEDGQLRREFSDDSLAAIPRENFDGPAH